MAPAVDLRDQGNDLRLALAKLHRAAAVDEVVRFRAGEHERDELNDIVFGAGFELLGVRSGVIRARRMWTLPDYVTPEMSLLICGLNPSPASSDTGVAFGRPGNRFWPAALRAGIVEHDRDPLRALTDCAMGMTDLAKRTTRRADELDAAEYKAGLDRVDRLARQLQPEVICMVGLAGWRAAVDRKASRGWQPTNLGDRPVYLMPSTSGLNAHDTVESLARHLEVAAGQ